MYLWVTRARSLVTTLWHGRADRWSIWSTGQRSPRWGHERIWAAPLKQGWEILHRKQTAGLVPTNKSQSQTPIKWFVNTSSSQPDGFKLCKTNANHTQATWQSWWRDTVLCVTSLTSLLHTMYLEQFRDAICILPTPCIPCLNERDDGFDLSNSHCLMQSDGQLLQP